MAIAALTRKLPHNPVRTAPSLARRIVNAFVVMAEGMARDAGVAPRGATPLSTSRVVGGPSACGLFM